MTTWSARPGAAVVALDARYGLIASSRDKILETHWGIPNGWDGAVIFVPPDPLFDATAAWLQGHGVKVLESAGASPLSRLMDHASA